MNVLQIIRELRSLKRKDGFLFYLAVWLGLDQVGASYSKRRLRRDEA